MIKSVKRLSKGFRDRLCLMQYHYMQYWIEWQAKKEGLNVIYLNPSYSSTNCPKCKGEMKEISYRYYSCINCDFNNDRDVIAIMNLCDRGYALISDGRGSLSLSTAPQMRYVTPNRCGEPSPFKAGRKSVKTP